MSTTVKTTTTTTISTTATATKAMRLPNTTIATMTLVVTPRATKNGSEFRTSIWTTTIMSPRAVATTLRLNEKTKCYFGNTTATVT